MKLGRVEEWIADMVRISAVNSNEICVLKDRTLFSRGFLAATFLLASFLFTLFLFTSDAQAERFYGSFLLEENIGSTTFQDEDLVLMNGPSATLFQKGSDFFTQDKDIDALYVDDQGVIYFSTSSQATIAGGIAGGPGGMDSGDIVSYNPATQEFNLYLADFGPNVDAFWIEAGVPYLSISTDVAVGSNNLAATDDDVFTLIGGVATSVMNSSNLLLGSGGSIATSTDLDAFAITDEGKYLFSTSGSNSLLKEGGNANNPSDKLIRDSGIIYLFDPANPGAFDARQESSIYFDPSEVYQTKINIDALHFLPPLIDADFNGDAVVDAIDYTVWRDSLGATGLSPYEKGDANGDGQVNQADFEFWKEQFGPVNPGSGSLIAGQVPEPSSVVLIALAGLTFCVGRKLRWS